MPDPLEYQSPAKAKPTKPWSIPAVLGFSLGIVAPPVGLALSVVVEQALGDGAVAHVALVFPYLAAIALSLIGFFQTRSLKEPMYGRRLAIAGLIVALIWAVLLALLFVVIVQRVSDL
jgi:hypothetical protein